MCKYIFRCGLLVLVISVAGVRQAMAQWAVVDAPAMVQLIQQVQVMEEELQTARNQLSQAQQALQTMTGGRGMELLLSGVQRNYLPSNWSQLTGIMQGGVDGYPGLAADVQSALGANAVLTSQQLAALSPANQQQIVAARQSSALQQALAQEALSNASGRFASLQSLIGAISTATDQKGALDLQNRISAELGMLQNEQTKQQILHEVTRAQDSINEEREREQALAGQGQFETRFRPVP